MNQSQSKKPTILLPFDDPGEDLDQPSSVLVEPLKLQEQITQLNSDRELVDDEINLYMSLLNKKYGINGKRKFMDTFYFASLMLKDIQIMDSMRASRFIRQLFNDNETLPDIVVIPVHILSNHWGAVVIQFLTRHILIIDPYDSNEKIRLRIDTTFTVELKKYAHTLIKLFSKWRGEYNYNHVFHNIAPWIVYRGPQLQPQTDDHSCGFYVALVCRVIGYSKNISEICMFDLRNIKRLKKLFDMELGMKKLSPDLDDIQLMVSPGVDKTKRFNTIIGRPTEDSIISLSCQINPMYVAYKTMSCHFRKISVNEQEYEEYKNVISNARTGDNFFFYANFDNYDVNDFAKRITNMFHTITRDRELLTQLDLDEITVSINCKMAYNCIIDRSTTLALELDWKNGCAPGGEPFLDTPETTVIYDTLTCLYHSLTKQCKSLRMLVTNNQQTSAKLIAHCEKQGSLIITFT